ncbi:MAG: hypothetical protein ABIH34_00505 [Nanoarchaeota archaeon]
MLEKTLYFLRKYGHLDDPERAPDFSAADDPGFMHPLAARYRWYQSNPELYSAPVSGKDVYQNDFPALEEITLVDFQKQFFRGISPSEEHILIDIGSGLWSKTLISLAKERPKTKFYLIDNMDIDQLKEAMGHLPSEMHAEIKTSVKETVQDYIKKAGLSHVSYFNHELRKGSLAVPSQGKPVAVTSWKAPKGLGNLVVDFSIDAGAQLIGFNNSATEMIPPDSAHYSLIKAYLSEHLKPHQIDKIISLIHDPNAKADMPPGERKYDHRIEGQRLFALALTLLFPLAQKAKLEQAGYAVDIYQNKTIAFYNFPSHHICAQRQ